MVVAPLAVVLVSAVFALPLTIMGFDEAGGLRIGFAAGFAAGFLATAFLTAGFFAADFLAGAALLFFTLAAADFFEDFDFAGTCEG